MNLWAHQQEAIDRLYAVMMQGIRKCLVVLPTGAGKSVIIARVALIEWSAGRRVIVMTHRKEIIDQIVAKLIEAGVSADEIGVIRANDDRANAAARIQVASIATLVNRKLPYADVVMIDEAHRAMADSYRRIAQCFPRAWHIGFTATPYRLDGRPLGDAYDELISTANYSGLIKAGILAEPLVYSVATEQLPDLADVRPGKGDYDLGDLGRVMNRRVLIGNMITERERSAPNHRTVIFATTIEHSHAICDEFNAAGVRTEHIDGKTAEAERERVLEALRSGQIDAVTNCDVLSEGWDMPECKCVIVARPTTSRTKHIQMTGRIFRPWNGVRPVINDHAGNVWRHDFPHADVSYGLTRRLKPPSQVGGGGELERVKRCPVCGLCTTPDAAMCSACGHQWAPSERKAIETVDGQLVELSKYAVIEARARKVAAKYSAPDWWVDRLIKSQMESQ